MNSDQLVTTVSLGDVFDYLRVKGWHQTEHRNPNISVWTRSNEQFSSEERVILPAREDLDDYRTRFSEALHIIADIESQPLQVLLRHLVHRSVDVIRARIHQIDLESISLQVASEIIPLFRDFIGYAACAQKDPRPFFARASSLAKEFAEHCRFGHTFKGSFGFTIECPIQLPQNRTLFNELEAPPFERQVIERVAFGSLTLEEATSNDDTHPIVQGYASGFNANMCEALAEAYEKTDGREIEFSFAWAPELMPARRVAHAKTFVIEQRTYNFLRTAAKELQKVQKPEETLVIGKIVMLKAEESPYDTTDEFQRLITMFWEMEKNLYIRIRVPLSIVEYRLACDAHKEGNKISIIGYPEKRGKYWYLDKPRNFFVMPK